MKLDWITHSLRRGYPSRPRSTRIDPAGMYRRNRVLEIIGGLWPHQILDMSIGGRMKVIEHLQERDQNCRRVWQDMPHCYDKSFHMMVLAELMSEQQAVYDMKAGVKPAGIQPRLKGI